MSGTEASVLWTIIAPEQVLGEGKFEFTATVELRADGRILEVIPGPYGVGAISRLISANPMDYLNPKWQPGTLVPLFPKVR